MLGAVSYTPESGEEVDVLPDANGAFGFAMPAADTDVSATLVDTRVRYMDEDGKEQFAVAREITALTPVTTPLTGWYCVKESVTFNDRIEAGKGFNLILCDGATLYAKKGIHVPAGSSLTIYAQSAGTGALTIDGLSMEYYNAGIGGNEYENAGTITIVGGRITAKGSYYGTSLVGGAGIGGGGRGGSGGDITISGGTVTATGGENAAGMKRLLGLFLSLALVLGMFPGMSLTAYAADTTITWDSSVINSIMLFEVNESYNNSGITVQMTAMEAGGFYGYRMISVGTATFVFSSTVGNIKGITINADNTGLYTYDGWTRDSTTVTWSGTPASSVTLSGRPINICDISSIVFTIEGARVCF